VGALHDVRVGPVLGIKERIAPDLDRRIGLGDSGRVTSRCRPVVHLRTTVTESMRTPILSLGATSSRIACMIEATPAITITLPVQKRGAPETTLLRI
jgi:hypothetical protein